MTRPEPAGSSPAYRWASRGLAALAGGSFIGFQAFLLKLVLGIEVPGPVLGLLAALTLLATLYSLVRLYLALSGEVYLTPDERRRYRLWLPLAGAVAALEVWLLLRERLPPPGPSVPK